MIGRLTVTAIQNALDPYGEWIEVGDYGTCWHPTGVADGWSPYTDGYWSYTDAGWTWVSYEDWGGVTYHYGRWVRVVGVGWVWVPDYEWGPAWVSWRSNDDYVGWAPLPPEATWDNDVGFSTWVDSSYDIGPGYYNFCHSYDFGCPVLAPVLCPPYECVNIFQQCVNITNICYDHGRHRSVLRRTELLGHQPPLPPACSGIQAREWRRESLLGSRTHSSTDAAWESA